MRLDQEKELIERAKLDPEYFAPLYEKYFESVFRFVFSRVRDRDLTGDICSQTFLKAIVAIKKYEFRGYPLSTWLFRIALNEVNMHFRKNSKINEVEITENSLAELKDEVFEDDGSGRIEMLVDGLNQLDEAATDLIEMRFFEKRRFSEIGRILGVTEDNAKVRVYRAIKKLKLVIGSEE